MIKLVLTQILQKTVNRFVYHQLLWSYLEVTFELMFVMMLLGISNIERESKSLLLQIALLELASKLKCNFTWHVL